MGKTSGQSKRSWAGVLRASELPSLLIAVSVKKKINMDVAFHMNIDIGVMESFLLKTGLILSCTQTLLYSYLHAFNSTYWHFFAY